jgi:hypothetical protein
MDFGERTRRWAGWLCLGAVATLTSMGYHFGNVRFAPVVVGFAILAAVCFLGRGQEEATSHGVDPGTNSRINRASG